MDSPPNFLIVASRHSVDKRHKSGSERKGHTPAGLQGLSSLMAENLGDVCGVDLKGLGQGQ